MDHLGASSFVARTYQLVVSPDTRASMSNANDSSRDASIPSQEMAFFRLYDVRRGGLKVPLAEQAAQAELGALNTSAVSSLIAVEQAASFSAGTTLCQGACLVVAVLQDLKWMESAWTGPPCEMSTKAVVLLQDFRNCNRKQVR